MGKIIDTTNLDSAILLKANLPQNLDKDNYYLEMLQHKVNYEWDYRYNRFDIEEENAFGSGKYHDVQVIIDNVYDDKLRKVMSDDWKKLIFKDIQHYLTPGQRFRFGLDEFGGSVEDINKSVWIVANLNKLSPTAGCVVRRCDSTLNMKSNDGKELHYEPCCLEDDFKAINTWFDIAINTPQAQICAIAQYNQYTKKIKINDRFILGETDLQDLENNLLYRVVAINKCKTKSTLNPRDVSFVVLGLIKDSVSAEDDLVNRIANQSPQYNRDEDEYDEIQTEDKYEIKIRQTNGEAVPETLFLDETVELQAICYKNKVEYSIPISIKVDLLGTDKDSYYYDFENKGDGIFEITNKKMYVKNKLEIECSVSDLVTEKIYIQLGGVS